MLLTTQVTIQFAPVLFLTSTGNLGYCHSKFPGINVCGLSLNVLCSCDVVNVSFSEIMEQLGMQKAGLYSPGKEKRSGDLTRFKYYC